MEVIYQKIWVESSRENGTKFTFSLGETNSAREEVEERSGSIPLP